MSEGATPRAIVVRDLRVLVTAGASGIGRAIAQAFAAGGAHVHITDVDEAAVADTVSQIPGLSATAGDASSPQDADRAAADVGARFGGLDVLVNNVGVAGPTGVIDSLSDGDVERTIDINLKSHFYFLNRCVPLLRGSTRNPGVVAMSSVAGRLGYGNRTPYAATKWAIVGLVKSLAVELGPDGVRANAILPGVVEGPRMDRVIAARAAAEGAGFDAVRDSYLGKISLRRMVQAEDVANLALFLSSDLARNITGQAISVDGNVEYL
ncbi:NAD(P)-dependent dehydrogenase (short-subunit alcohol dehydrogenase family) [Roseiarcus fermentans]|uniref:NAD(P)-dependent dehydrogenase (Short-subunit alcohol dehydrogenase family) n=1 Tax=Roseiarcus fermentans TaxID=1473586 RepID=A0A366F0H1_9HYPH|nr:SDR family oxidoreductase [Roseiarcus fermentans]RBP08158.1 NAD(P)-dependent dehydrogenase (short-subunit alcohol dehydrogenase family) [Roseiarcus fermentans]